MFNKDKKKVNEANTKYEEMEVAEEFGGYYCFDIITYKFCDLCRVAIS